MRSKVVDLGFRAWGIDRAEKLKQNTGNLVLQVVESRQDLWISECGLGQSTKRDIFRTSERLPLLLTVFPFYRRCN